MDREIHPNTWVPEEDIENENEMENKRRMVERALELALRPMVREKLSSNFTGVSVSEEEQNIWADILVSLIIQVVSLLNPDEVEKNDLNLHDFVKIKCIASETRGTSGLFRGLVFRKSPVHKVMPTHFENPTLLLLRGSLDGTSNGFTSFKNELDYEYIDGTPNKLYDVIKSLTKGKANVFLVEECVSFYAACMFIRRHPDLLVVSNMKSRRLERVARFTGSRILTPENVSSQNLEDCSSAFFKKVEETHAQIEGDEKSPLKTLMFISCHNFPGCTILLKGSNYVELKMVKKTARFAVEYAYQLMQEFNFILDLNKMFFPNLLQMETSEVEFMQNAGIHNNGGLVILSRNSSTGITCERNEFLSPKLTFSKYLQENLLTQNFWCNECGELPEEHTYTCFLSNSRDIVFVRVQKLAEDNRLSGEEEEEESKLWIWSQCAKCEGFEEKSCSTKRVPISTASSGMLLASFLELRFLERFPFNRNSSCGHSLSHDFFHFVGLGSVVSIFKLFPRSSNEDEDKQIQLPPPLKSAMARIFGCCS